MAQKEKKPQVLVADDEPEVIDLVRMMLEMEGYSILEAADGEQTLACTRSELPDLILLDVRMPRMSGLAVLDELQSDPATAHIPIIMLSVVTTYPEVRKALQQGAIAYLSKPFELRQMTNLVARVLEMDIAERQRLRQRELESINRRW
jgi:CheY-like chemotaxis protein